MSDKKSKQRRHSTKTLAIRGVLFNWIGRGCSFVITFVATPIILGTLGNEAYGLWAIVMSVGSYYALADVGMQAACTKYIAEFEATGDRDHTQRLFSTSILLYSIMALVVLLVAIPVAWFFPYLFEIREHSTYEIRWAVFLTGVSVAIRLQAQVFVSAIKALKRFDIANATSVVTQCIDAALTISVVLAGFGLIGMACVMVSMTLVSRLVEAHFASRLLGGLRFKLWAFDREMFNSIFRFSSWHVVGQVAGRLHNRSAPIIIGVLLGPALVPFFALANSLIQKGYSLTQSVSSVVMPVASELNAQNRQAALLRIGVLSARTMTSLAVMGAVIVVCFGESFIELWLGPGYAETVGPMLVLLSMAFIADMTSGGIRSVLAGINRVDLVTRVNSVWALVTVALGIAFTYWHGIIGMGWALLVSSFVVNVGLSPFLMCRLVGQSWTAYMREVLLRPLILGTIGVGIGLGSSWAIGSPANLWQWFAMAGAVGAVMAATSVFVVLDQTTRGEVQSSLRRRRPKFHRNSPSAADHHELTALVK